MIPKHESLELKCTLPAEWEYIYVESLLSNKGKKSSGSKVLPSFISSWAQSRLIFYGPEVTASVWMSIS